MGTQVTLAARVEPVTLPGHVWATDTFISVLRQHSPKHLGWDDLGDRPLAKEWGAQRLYRLRRANEPMELPSLGQTLGARSAGHPEGLELCLRMLEIGNDAQRLAAMDVLGQIDHPDATRALITAAKQKSYSHSMRRMAFGSMQELKSPTFVPDLLDILRDPEEPTEVIGWCIQVLGDIKDPRAVPVLAEIVEGSETTNITSAMKEKATFALGRIRDERSIASIKGALASENMALVRAAVAAAGIAADPRSSAALGKIVEGKEKWPEEVRGAAIEALLTIGPNPAQEKILRDLALDEGEPIALRGHAVMFLGVVGTDSARATLSKIAERLADPLSSDALVALFKADEVTKKMKERIGKAANHTVR